MNCLKFHPNLLQLAAASTDSYVSLYGYRKYWKHLCKKYWHVFKNTALDTGNTENPCVCNTNTGSAKIIDRKNTEESNAKILEGGPHQKKNVQALWLVQGLNFKQWVVIKEYPNATRHWLINYSLKVFFTKDPMIILNKKPIKKHLAETAETRTWGLLSKKTTRKIIMLLINLGKL